MRLAHSSRGVPIRYDKTPDVVAYFLAKLQYYVNLHRVVATKPTRDNLVGIIWGKAPMDFNAWLIDVSGQIDGFLYTYILLALLVIVGIYYTIRTKAVQIRYIKDMFTQITEKKHVEGKRSISSFQALMVSTASRVGTGNIAGVATALARSGRAHV